MFDIQNLRNTIDQRIEAVEASEKVTRDILRDLSRDVLFALHEHGDIGFVNRVMLAKTTSINKKALRMFFQEFTGFFYSKETDTFEKKDKRQYDAKQAACLEFLADPHNNFWTWADREIEMERKAFDPKKVTRYIENSLKKAESDGFSQADVIRAVLNAGLELDALIAIIDEQAIPQAEAA